MQLGEDVRWWLVPTQPVLTINYLEKVYSKRDIVNMYRLDEFPTEPKMVDAHYSERKSQSLREKVFYVLLLVALFIVVGLMQEWYLEDYNEDGKYEPIHRKGKKAKENDKMVPVNQIHNYFDGPKLSPKLN